MGMATQGGNDAASIRVHGWDERIGSLGERRVREGAEEGVRLSERLNCITIELINIDMSSKNSLFYIGECLKRSASIN